ncbi:hypothetical protein ACFE04_007918 [Oxalis oulophora]
MDGNFELEEGEAYYNDYYNNDDDENNVDPDIDFSYIDEKVQNLLGHFQKDFEGALPTENLGAKYGGYGSFLPTYERSPATWSCQKTPHKNPIPKKSTESFTMKGISQNLTAPSRVVPPSARQQIASCNSQSLNTGLPSQGVSNAEAAENFTVNDRKSGDSKVTDQRALKFRIKIRSDHIVQNNAAIYSGLGLGDSPSLSPGSSSPENSEGILPVSQNSGDGSPTSIIQVMTSFPVPRGAPISPLLDSLLSFSMDRKPVYITSESNGENSVLRLDQQDSVPGNTGKLLKKREVELIGKHKKAVGSKHDNVVGGFNFEEESTFEEKAHGCKEILSKKTVGLKNENGVGGFNFEEESKKTFKEKTHGCQEILLNRSKQNPLQNSVGSSKISIKTRKDEVKGRLVSVKDSLVSRSQNVESSRNIQHEIGNDGRLKGNKFAPSKACPVISKSDENLNSEGTYLSKRGVGQKATQHEEDGFNIPFMKEKPSLSGKKKLKSNNSDGKAGALSKKENLESIDGLTSKNKSNSCHVSSSRSETSKVKPQKILMKVKGNNMDSSDMPASQRPKDTGLSELEIVKSAGLKKSKDKFTIKNHIDRPVSQGSIKNSPSISEMALPAVTVDPTATQDWACCDNCEKWRVLPLGIKPEHLPDKWLCSMQSWLPPGLNRCDVSEDYTNKIVDPGPTYQIPVTEDQVLTQARPLDGNHNKLNLDDLPVGGKKKLGFRVTMPTGTSSGLSSGSDVAKNNLQDSVKTRKLNDTTQPVAELNLSRKSSSQSLTKSKNLNVEKQMPKQKAIVMNEGDVKKIRMKTKREADHYVCEPSKKIKVGDPTQMSASRTGHLSSVGLPTKVSGKSMHNYNECSISEGICDTKDILSVSIRKQGVQNQDSLDSPVKKRKFKESQEDSQNDNDIIDSIKRTKVKENSVSGLREEKIRALKTEKRQSSINSVDGKPNKKGMIFKIHSSGTRKFEGVDKDQRPQKIKRKFSHQQPLDGVDSFKGDFGSAQISTIAISSSSLVSGSRKTRRNTEDVKGSPVESVCSSPTRSTRVNKSVAVGGSILGRDDTVLGSLPAIENSKIICKSKSFDFDNGQNVLHLKHNSRSSAAISESNVSAPSDKKEKLHLKKSLSYASEVDCSHDLPCPEIVCDEKPKFALKSSIKSGKDEKNHVGMKNSVSQRSRDVQIKPKDNNHSSVNLDSQCGIIGKTVAQQKTSHEFDGESKATDPETKSGVSNIFSNSEDLGKNEIHGHQTVLGSKQSDPHGVNISSPVRFSTSQVAANALREAKDLRDRADRLKSSGFGFDSNEAYFQAALKFLHAASLLEASCSDGGGIHGEMTHIQAYIASAKLCDDCAREYERRRDMATATLAYKCMEVAFMRVVYGKHPFVMRDHNELQATLQMAPQGESPSSSVSDLDNLNNNQSTIDKSSSSKGSFSHVNNQATVARHRTSIVRLLDLGPFKEFKLLQQQHVDFAMEASKKSLSTFAAAKIILEETQNSDCIDSVKRVMEFSFQDVEGLIRLIRLAVEDIHRLCLRTKD